MKRTTTAGPPAVALIAEVEQSIERRCAMAAARLLFVAIDSEQPLPESLQSSVKL